MKNKIILSLLASSVISSVAMADFYIGLEYGAGQSEAKGELSGYGSTKIDNNYQDIKLKVGAGSDGGLKFQVGLSFISLDEKLFDDSNSDLIEIGVDIIKEFEVTKEFYPFIKAGVGAGTMSVDGYTEERIMEVSFNAGAGVSYKAVEHLYLIAGVDYVGRKWQDIEYQTGFYSINTLSITESGFKPYIGVNYQF